MTAPRRPIVFDLSHIVSRMIVDAPSGIDRVDMLYASHLAGETPRLAAATHYALRNPNLLSPQKARAIMQRAADFWRESETGDADPMLDEIVRWLDETEAPRPAAAKAVERLSYRAWLERYAFIWKYRLTFELGGKVPSDSIYLNCAQYLLEHPIFFRWLDSRADIAKVFFVHDLLPLDNPEFFREGYRERFERRFATIARHASALIVASDAVRDRINVEWKLRGFRDMPVHVAALPAPEPRLVEVRPVASRTPYFITIGTIEPRKNHLLLLNIWRELARGPGPVPRLLIVGSRGWENEQVLDALDRSSTIRPHVFEASGLSSVSLRNLLAGARALLMPSFDEGFGLPVVEALSVGTPVIASDRPVFRAVSQGCATFLNPIDGMAWLSAIRQATAWSEPERQAARTAAHAIRLQGVDSYFESVFGFLASL